MKSLNSILLIASLAILASQVVAGPGFTCLRAAGDPKQFWNLDKVNKGDTLSIPATSTEQGDSGLISVSACHVVNNLPSECDSLPNWNTIAVVSGKDANQKPYCLNLSQAGTTKKDEDTLWAFEATSPPAQRFVKFVASKTKAVFYMLRGAPVSPESGSQNEPLELLADADFGDSRGLIVTGTNVGRNSIGTNIRMNLTCDQDMKTGLVKDRSATYDAATKTYIIGWTSKSNCGFDLFSFWSKLGWGQYIVEGVLALGCIIMCFYGFKLYKPSLGVIGFLVGGLVTYIFLNLFTTPDSENDWYMWVVIGVSVVIGIIMAVLLIVVEKVSLFGAGAFLGYVGGAELYNLVIFRLDGDGTPIFLYVTIVVLAIIGGCLALWLHDQMIILSTAVGGAYLGVKLIGGMAGNFPDETTIAQRIAAGEWDGMPWINYVYIIAQLVLAVVGTVVQCCLHKKKEEDGNDENKENFGARYEGMV